MRRRVRFTRAEKEAQALVRQAQKREARHFKEMKRLYRKSQRAARRLDRRERKRNSELRRLSNIAYIVVSILMIAIAVPICFIFAQMTREWKNTNVFLAILSIGTLIFVVSAVVIGVFLFIYDWKIIKPLSRLSRAMDRVTDGDFTVRLEEAPASKRPNTFNTLNVNFNKMVAELASTQALKTDMLVSVSHELKTPLSSIHNLASLMVDGQLSPAEVKDYAERIDTITITLNSLIQQILLLSKIEHQKIVVDRTRFNLSEELCRCMIGFEPIWEERGIELETDLDDTLEVFTSQGLLDLVWNNLLSNAFKFTPEGGRVTLSARASEGMIAVSVSDTGCGIAEGDLKHIYEKFYQGETESRSRGNGLGLALVKDIVDLLDAEIKVISEVGKGTTFTVSLPVAPAADAAIEEAISH